VRRTAERLGYRPNAAAQALRTGRTHTIGVAVRQLSHPFFAAILEGIEGACRAAGYHLLLGDVRSDEAEEKEIVTLLAHGRADGLLVLGELPDDEPAVRAALRLGAPTVLVARQALDHASGVALDHERAMALALEHLRELGHRSVAMALPDPARPMPAAQMRAAAVDAYAAAHEWPAPRALAVGESGVTALAGMLENLLSRPPGVTAVLASDGVAVRVLKAAQAAGIDVPRDLSIVALDGTPMTTLTTPELTAVTQPLREIGAVAVAQLLERLAERASDGARRPRTGHASGTTTLEPQFTIRASTSGPRRACDGRQ
ncbi:MAG TPA: LacI family DNA-binding transcriptional regulator, partial [Chloroflexota bacterium]|nr:LacI family DNA-binding transcriptional regulator [Chloroflexota bacterium]